MTKKRIKIKVTARRSLKYHMCEAHAIIDQSAPHSSLKALMSVSLSVPAGAPLAPPPSDATKPKIPSGPDLRVPGPPSPSLGATPQLANAPSKAASKVCHTMLFCIKLLQQAAQTPCCHA